MKTVAVILGGRTCEHDVSIISGMQGLNSIDPTKYTSFPIYISGEGDWYIGEPLRDMEFYKKIDLTRLDKVLPYGNGGRLMLARHPESGGVFGKGKLLASADIVMPVMHGMNGEDGALQGMLDMMNVPYTSSGVLGCAVGMDKIAMKQLFIGCGFPVLDYAQADRADWEAGREAELDRIESKLEYPMFVKPANLGSSIGIGRADDRQSLADAIDVAASYDRRVLIEKGISEVVEVNCSVLGYSGDVRVSELEMPIKWDDAEILDFDKKYMSGEGGKGMESLSRKIPAPIEADVAEKIRQLSKAVFRALDSKGVVRIDYMIDKSDGSLYVGEINTIPGSLAFYLWEAAGMTFMELTGHMIECALAAKRDRDRNVFTYDSAILSKLKRGGAKS